MKTRITQFGLVLAGAALLGGCAGFPPKVGEDYKKPEIAVPSQWSVAASSKKSDSAQRLAKWWRQFNDPQLDKLIDEALAGSYDLKLAQAKLRQARASRAKAASGMLPTVTASTSATRTKYSSANSYSSTYSSTTGGTAGGIPTRTLYDAGFDASWEIDIFGGTRRGIEAAEADLASSEASLNDTRVSLVAEVAQNYIELISYRQRAEIARKNLASQSETLQITEWRYQAGLVTSTDVEQARTNREQTRASIPDLDVSQTEAENTLAVLLGKNPGSLRDQLKDAHNLPALPAAVATGIPADVLTQRPDLIATERTLAAETARTGQKLANRFPSLNLTGSLGWQAYSFGALGAAGTLTRVAAGTLAATLFDGGNLRSQVEIQSAVQEQALITYQKSVLTALKEVENALTAYAAGRERVDARSAAAESARNAAGLTRKQYESGLVDFQKVLDTERTLLTAEDNLASAEAGMRTSLITLYKALGGGWEQTADVAAK